MYRRNASKNVSTLSGLVCLLENFEENIRPSNDEAGHFKIKLNSNKKPYWKLQKWKPFWVETERLRGPSAHQFYCDIIQSVDSMKSSSPPFLFHLHIFLFLACKQYAPFDIPYH